MNSKRQIPGHYKSPNIISTENEILTLKYYSLHERKLNPNL